MIHNTIQKTQELTGKSHRKTCIIKVNIVYKIGETDQSGVKDGKHSQ